MSKTKPGMPSPALTEDDVRRAIAEFVEYCCYQNDEGDLIISADDYAIWQQAIPTDQEDKEDKTPHATPMELGEYTDIPPWV